MSHIGYAAGYYYHTTKESTYIIKLEILKCYSGINKNSRLIGEVKILDIYDKDNSNKKINSCCACNGYENARVIVKTGEIRSIYYYATEDAAYWKDKKSPWNGEWKCYDDACGKLITHYFYKDGEKDGRCVEYYDDIGEYKIIYYMNGELVPTYMIELIKEVKELKSEVKELRDKLIDFEFSTNKVSQC